MTSRSDAPGPHPGKTREVQVYRETYKRELAELRPDALPKYQHIAGEGWRVENIQMLAAGVVQRTAPDQPTEVLEYKEFRVYLKRIT